MQGGEICHWQNAVGKGMRRFGKKLCKQGSPYKKLQKSAGSAIVQNRLMPCWDKTKPSWDRQAAGLHTEFGVQAALRAPHRQIPQGASPRHEYPSFATCTFPGRNSGFFFVLRALYRSGRGFPRAAGLGRLHAQKRALAYCNTPCLVATRPPPRQHALPSGNMPLPHVTAHHRAPNIP